MFKIPLQLSSKMISKIEEENLRLKNEEDLKKEAGILSKEQLAKLKTEGNLCIFGGFCIHLVKRHY